MITSTNRKIPDSINTNWLEFSVDTNAANLAGTYKSDWISGMACGIRSRPSVTPLPAGKKTKLVRILGKQKLGLLFQRFCGKLPLAQVRHEFGDFGFWEAPNRGK
jgi:hypothetical protein